jgi:Tfp pilus assembly protein PilZ
MSGHAMEEDPSEPGSERRSAPRIPTRLLVEVKLPTWDALQRVHTVNLSMGGMRLSLGARAALGAAIDIILTLPNGERLHLPGKVAHLGPGGGGDVGVRYDELPQHTLDKIRRYVDELAAGRTPSPKVSTIPPGVLIKTEKGSGPHSTLKKKT